MIDHLADLESDFSAIHRIDDMYALDGPKFLRLAWRMPAYEGVMRLRLAEQERTAEPAVDGFDDQLVDGDDVASEHTVRHALSLIPAGAEVTVVGDDELVV